ncbi:MAG: helix-turn-helix domain-containing protein [Candidatus Bathyarchaeia archaeon]
MRKLVVEFPREELDKVEGDSQFLQKVKTLKVLVYLRYSNEEILMVCKVELDPEISNIEEYLKIVDYNIYDIQILEKEKGGAYLVLVKHKLKLIDDKLRTQSQVMWEKSGYVISREIWGGKFRITFLGTLPQIKETLKTLKKMEIRHRVVYLADATFSSDSQLKVLTEKQRRVLVASYKLGYFDLPRRISARQLAEKLGIHKSAVATHIRKAERRLLADILSEA